MVTFEEQWIQSEQSCLCGYLPSNFDSQDVGQTASEIDGYWQDFLTGLKIRGEGHEKMSSTPSLHPRKLEQDDGWGKRSV